MTVKKYLHHAFGIHYINQFGDIKVNGLVDEPTINYRKILRKLNIKIENVLSIYKTSIVNNIPIRLIVYRNKDVNFLKKHSLAWNKKTERYEKNTKKYTKQKCKRI